MCARTSISIVNIIIIFLTTMFSRAYSFDSAQTLYGRTSKSSFHSPMVRSRKNSLDKDTGKEVNDPWGWFEDFEATPWTNLKDVNLDGDGTSRKGKVKNSTTRDVKMDLTFPLCQPLHKALSLPPPASDPPFYILESNLETQQLWYSTAGKRPKQPTNEREYYEQIWTQNFQDSKVQYEEPIEAIIVSSIYSTTVDQAVNSPSMWMSSPKKGGKLRSDDIMHTSEFDGEVIFKGRSPFSYSVSKSFNDFHISFMTVHIPYYRVFRSHSTSLVRAEFLIVVSLGSPSAVTFGVWRRHSDFTELVQRLKELNMKSGGEKNVFKNTLLSWDCVLQRKRWFKCLEKEYLTLKSFLLERFMHDLLFESETPNIISNFMGFKEEF